MKNQKTIDLSLVGVIRAEFFTEMMNRAPEEAKADADSWPVRPQCTASGESSSRNPRSGSEKTYSMVESRDPLAFAKFAVLKYFTTQWN